MGGGRLALVVGSECAALATLEFPGQLAIELHSRLGGLGGWQDATSLPGPLLNPTAAELAAAVDEAFAAASRQRATLLISFVGHGTATGAEDFYLLARDSPVLPNSGTAFHLTQGIRERLNTAAVDGLIVLVDACDTGQGVQGAARRWSELLARSQGRMELLVAAGEGPAFAGCFTRTMVTAFDTGLGLRGRICCRRIWSIRSWGPALANSLSICRSPRARKHRPRAGIRGCGWCPTSPAVATRSVGVRRRGSSINSPAP